MPETIRLKSGYLDGVGLEPLEVCDELQESGVGLGSILTHAK